MKIKVSCTQCHTELRIHENLFFFAHSESMEKAICVSCSAVVLEATIQGWYFVEDVKKPESKVEKECTYPMP